MSYYEKIDGPIPAHGSNNAGSRSTFYDRALYKDEVYPEGTNFPRNINFWYEKPMYGKVDREGNAVYFDENQSIMKALSGDDGNLLSPYFVADAFSHMQSYLRRATYQGNISSEGSNLTLLRPKKAWVSSQQEYSKYINMLYEVFVDTFLEQDASLHNHIRTFDTFMDVFMMFAHRIARKFPITRTGFLMSRHYDTMCSGLGIELGSHDHGEDIDKQIHYIEDPNFEFYVRAAKQFGFYVDKNAPWRLVANLSSPFMKDYIFNSADSESTTSRIDDHEHLYEVDRFGNGVARPIGEHGHQHDIVEWKIYTTEGHIHNLPLAYSGAPMGINDPANYFDIYTNRSHRSDHVDLSELMLSFYNRYVEEYPDIREEVSCDAATGGRYLGGKTYTKLVEVRQQLGRINYINEYGDLYWINKLFMIRAYEIGASWSAINMRRKIINAQSMAKSFNTQRALEYINREVKREAQVVSGHIRKTPSYTIAPSATMAY